MDGQAVSPGTSIRWRLLGAFFLAASPSRMDRWKMPLRRSKSWVAFTMFVVTAAAGCLGPGGPPEPEGEVLMVELGGSVVGDERHERSVCTPPPRYWSVDHENRTIAYVASYAEVPPHPDAILAVSAAFASPCGWAHFVRFTNGSHLPMDLTRGPFRWSRNFTIQNDTLVAEGVLIPPDGSWRVPVNETREGIHYTGYMEVRNLGMWPRSGIDAVSSHEKFQREYGQSS